MSKRSRRQSKDNYKKKRTLRTIAICALLVIVSTISLSVVGFASDGFQNKDVMTWLDKEVNEKNLIKAENYQIEDEQDDGKGIKARVNEDGVIKLSGKATSDNSFVVCTVELAPGEYTISGVKSTDNYGLQVTGADNLIAKAGTSSDTFTIETAQTVTVSIYVTEDTWLFNKKITPVLVSGADAGDFYE